MTSLHKQLEPSHASRRHALLLSSRLEVVRVVIHDGVLRGMALREIACELTEEARLLLTLPAQAECPHTTIGHSRWFVEIFLEEGRDGALRCDDSGVVKTIEGDLTTEEVDRVHPSASHCHSHSFIHQWSASHHDARSRKVRKSEKWLKKGGQESHRTLLRPGSSQARSDSGRDLMSSRRSAACNSARQRQGPARRTNQSETRPRRERERERERERARARDLESLFRAGQVAHEDEQGRPVGSHRVFQLARQRTKGDESRVKPHHIAQQQREVQTTA